ncbi:MAG: DUF1292 domain-containing protein [Clostridia bacterium]|nr:DUF1292 domain-containing protein [Clostridia bacterium]
MSKDKDELFDEEKGVVGDMVGDDEVIQLVTDDGVTLDFFHVGTVDYEGKWYVLLQPAEEMEDIDDDELVIFNLKEGDDGDVLEPVLDDELLDKIYEKYAVEFYGEDGCECDHEGCNCGEHDDCECEGDCDCHEHTEGCDCGHEGCDCTDKKGKKVK